MINTNKLFIKLLEKPEIKGIPLVYVMTVTSSVFDVIREGECYYDSEEKQCLSNGIQTQQVAE